MCRRSLLLLNSAEGRDARQGGGWREWPGVLLQEHSFEACNIDL